MTSQSKHFLIPDVPVLGARTFQPSTLQEVRRCLLYNVQIYDTLIWQDTAILRLPFHRYRVTALKTGQSERIGGKSATYALNVLLKRLGIDLEVAS